MSGKALTWAKKITIPLMEKTILLVIASSFNDKKGCCFPTNKTLAKWCCCSERTVRRHIKSLISKNIIQKEDVRNQLGHRVTSKYTLNFDQNLDEKVTKTDKVLNSLPDNISCGQLQSLPDRESSLPDRESKPTGQRVLKDYIINKNINKNKTKKKEKNIKKRKKEPSASVKFEQFYKHYPRHKDRSRAEAIFKKLNPDDELFAKIMEAVENQKQEYKLKHEDNFQFFKYAAPWLNGKCWTDEVDLYSIEKEKQKRSPYTQCVRCGKEILKTLGLGGYCEKCDHELHPLPSLQTFDKVVHA